jgi:hypothetical protein
VAGVNPSARVYRTSFGDVPLQWVLDVDLPPADPHAAALTHEVRVLTCLLTEGGPLVGWGRLTVGGPEGERSGEVMTWRDPCLPVGVARGRPRRL